MARIRMLASSLALAAFAAGAQDAGTLARELMVKSGLDRQLDDYPALVQAGMEQGRAQSGLGDAQFDELKAAAGKAFDPKMLKRVVLREISKALTGMDMQAALAWLDAPLGARITRLEERASTAEAFAAMQAWAQALKPGQVPAARIAQVQRLDRAAKATDFAVSSARNSQLAIVAAVTATLPAADQRRAFEAVQAAFEQNRDQIRRSAEQQTLVALLYTYRDLADDDLDRYIAFAESPAGRKYQAATATGLDHAIVEASRDAGRIIGEALRNKKQKAGLDPAPSSRAAARAPSVAPGARVALG